MAYSLSLQQRYAPQGICFGCGPANPQGLQIQSYPGPDGSVRAVWQAEPHHQAFSGFLNGGIVSSLLDCHCNWTAIHYALQEQDQDRQKHEPVSMPPSTVTARLDVEFLAPTSSHEPIELSAKVVEAAKRKYSVAGEVRVQGTVTAKCQALFIAVRQGHPAWHRW